VLVAEGDPNVRTALRVVLERMPRVRVVGQSENVDELLRDSAVLHPDVILVDLELHGMRADNHLAALRSSSHGAAMIALSTHDEMREPALHAGAMAFVCKRESPLRLLETLNAVLGAAP
jgi:DNA-binding NarL/FixJ family response regulator